MTDNCYNCFQKGELFELGDTFRDRLTRDKKAINMSETEKIRNVFRRTNPGAAMEFVIKFIKSY